MNLLPVDVSCVMLPAMTDNQQSYSVDDVTVTLARDPGGVRWECSKCGSNCEHILKAAVWLTLASWPAVERMH